MKKLLLIPVALLFGASVAFYSCSDDDDEDKCVKIAEDIAAAATAWANEPTNSDLQDAYCEELEKGIDQCADNAGFTAWQYAYDGANCGTK